MTSPPVLVREIVLYETEDGRAPFADWFDALDAQAAAKITVVVEKMRLGNLSALKSVGEGVQEFRLDWAQAIACTSGATETR